MELYIKKGLDIKIAGKPAGSPLDAALVAVNEIAITPDDFPGLTLKPSVKEGERVCAGMPLMHDKRHEAVVVASPAGGIVKAVVRGERRRLERIVVTVDVESQSSTTFNVAEAVDRDSARKLLQQSGLWAFLRQRPYNIVADAEAAPRDIFVSGWDSAPLAPDTDAILVPEGEALAAGVKLLKLLTDGNLYFGRKAGSLIADIPGAVMVDISGPHPAGNAGVMAANIHPVNKGEIIWTLDGATLAAIGSLMLTGSVPMERVVALTGSEIATPGYVKCLPGAAIGELLDGRLKQTGANVRIISGNVLTGHTVNNTGYLRYPYSQVTAIPEGDDVVEFMGWASLSSSKMSTSRSFPGRFLFRKLFSPDARLLGGRRAMIMSGEYDRVVPMDIMTEYLVKAILSRNIEQMEALGIYEIAPEDVAVAEYVCTSKMPLQQIVAEGLEYLRKELE